MSDSFYLTTESSILKNKGPKHTHLAMSVSHVLVFCVGIRLYSALTYDVMKSYIYSKEGDVYEMTASACDTDVIFGAP